MPSETSHRRPPASAPVPYFVSDGRFSVLVVGGPKAVAMDSISTRKIDASCAERSAPGELPPGVGSESLALNGQMLVVIVIGAPKGTDRCEIEWNESPLSIWRAAVLPATDGTIARVPLAARLIVDGIVLNPRAAYRRPAHVRTAEGWRREGAQLRYYYDMSGVRPRDDGHSAQIELQIWDRDRAPTLIDVEGAAAARLGMEHVEWTLATHPAGEVAARRTLASTREIASAVVHMLDTAKIDLVAAGIGAAAWTSSNQDSVSASSVVARLVSAEALLAQGEPDLARAVVASVQRSHRCLVSPAGSSGALVQLVASTRASSARCEPVSPLHAAALSIVPGLGNLAVGDRGKAALGAGLVAGALVRALMVNSTANSRYAEYLASRDRLEVGILYDRVNDLRRERTIMLSAAAGLWILDALSAVSGAQSHIEKVANDRF